jgi:glycosyltransferase involved in cell wall biosynthesis
MIISVITPTYNRAYILRQCYESLCAQISPNFEWIVVDDGSTDDTKQLIDEFIAEGKIPINYYHQPNGGKHRAHNLGVKHANGELIVCLDSDDQLSPDAISSAIDTWTSLNTESTIGILAPRGDLVSHKRICSDIPHDLLVASRAELRDDYGFEGDTVLFISAYLLKEHPFKEFEGEKFLTEDNLYCDLDNYGKMIILDKVLYYCEYREDGLTAKYHKLLFNNPKGTTDTYYKMALNATTFIKAFKYAIISNAYNNLIDRDSRIKYEKRRCVMALANIAAPIFSFVYLNKFKK